MKTFLLTAILSITFLQTNAQCTEAASSFGNNSTTPTYNVQGDISVTLNTNKTITINFASNYSTASGPDVRLYLIKSEGRTTTELKSINPTSIENISFGLVGFSGAQSFTQNIPNNIDITKYDTVFFYCLQFTAFWDLGSYTPFSANNCSVLDVTTFSLDDVSIYPNPASNKIQLSNIDAVSTEVCIFNTLGKKVFHRQKLIENSIDVSHLNNGIYLLKIIIDGKSKTQKLVIQ